MNAAARKPDRILLAILAAIALLVITALAVVFFRGAPQELDESTPAGVVQRYSTAVITGDTATADTFLTEEARGRCNGYFGPPEATRVVLVSTSERGDSATVRVSIVHSSPGGPFGPSEFEMEEAFSLVKDGGRWKVNQAPYQLMSCGGAPARPASPMP
ncbi:hypothetical protein F8G81_12470 [Arthrobacter sp. CDRTa11]|uniref:hypothetical protein n=1 Tax=Arthrobacter sp. CDRTa11 TaxID=2651199 RepID=UPI0022658378|nr:hypothetical protein [Arthrobacter sp. CDRTa11]UZX03331.1 hypothetical protein F8G81_12470 [Arthrobacter sp. CDRTa11]